MPDAVQTRQAPTRRMSVWGLGFSNQSDIIYWGSFTLFIWVHLPFSYDDRSAACAGGDGVLLGDSLCVAADEVFLDGLEIAAHASGGLAVDDAAGVEGGIGGLDFCAEAEGRFGELGAGAEGLRDGDLALEGKLSAVYRCHPDAAVYGLVAGVAVGVGIFDGGLADVLRIFRRGHGDGGRASGNLAVGRVVVGAAARHEGYDRCKHDDGDDFHCGDDGLLHNIRVFGGWTIGGVMSCDFS